MKKKRTIDRRKNVADISDFSGLDEEDIIEFGAYFEKLPLRLSCCGITHPTPYYRIKRPVVRMYILEYVESGKGYIEINGKTLTVKAGDVYFLKPGEVCEYYSDPTDPYKKKWVNFASEIVGEIVKSYGLSGTVYDGVDISDLFDELFALESVSTSNADIYVDASDVILRMLMRLAKSVQGKRKASVSALKIRQILHYSVDKPVTIEEIAADLLTSPENVIKTFKESYGRPPYRYLMDLRIDYAKSLLENDDLSIKEISERFCFSDAYYFSNYFKKRVGVSPTRYRKDKKN